MKILSNLKYTKTHEWAKFEDDGTVLAGLTDFAQEHLGDLVFVNLPEVGDPVTAGEPFCDVESVKAVSDVYAPVSGEIIEVNEALADNPALINEDPYDAWLVKIGSVEDNGELLDAAAYDTFAKEEAED